MRIGPARPRDFRDALKAALAGDVLSDTGMPDDVADALADVAAAKPGGPKQARLAIVARQVWDTVKA